MIVRDARRGDESSIRIREVLYARSGGGAHMSDPSEFDDIPGTVVFTGRQSRKGYQLNQFCMSLRQPRNRERFKKDESAYLDDWPLTESQRKAVLDRDYNAAIAEGGNIY